MTSDATRRERLTARIHADQLALTRAIVREHPPALLEVDLTMRQLQCLMHVAVEPGSTSQDLAERLGVRQPTVSRLLDRLIAAGLVERGVDERDRRRHPLWPSRRGADLLSTLTDANVAAFDRLYARADVEALEQVAESMAALRHVADSGGPAESSEPLEAPGSPEAGQVVLPAGSVQIGLLQFASSLDADENLTTITALAESAVAGLDRAAGPVLLVAPEAAMCDFGPSSFDLSTVAQRLDGPFVSGLSTLASRLGVVIVAGMFERPARRSRRVYNTLVVVGADGEVVTSYRKIHLYDAFGYAESARLLPGALRPTTFDLGGLRFGLMTCYDLRFPELAAELVAAGAQALVLPAAWLAGEHKVDHWTTLLRARAIETTSYVVASAQAEPAYCGTSMIVDPMGLAVVEASGGQQVASGTLSPARIEEIRTLNPTLRNRRSGWPGSS